MPKANGGWLGKDFNITEGIDIYTKAAYVKLLLLHIFGYSASG